MRTIAAIVALCATVAVAGPRSRGGPDNYDLGEARTRLYAGLALWYPLGTDDPALTFTDYGPYGQNMTVVADGGYPLQVTSGGYSYRTFTRAGTVTGTISSPYNYGIKTDMSKTTFAAILGQPFTVAFWINRAQTGATESTGSEVVFNMSGDGFMYGNGAPQLDAAMHVQFTRSAVPNTMRVLWGHYVGPFSNGVTKTLTYLPPFGAWVHLTFQMLAGSAGNSYVKLYVNGQYQESTTEGQDPSIWTPASIPDSGCAIIGRNPSAILNGQLGASLRDVRVYSRVLTDQDIATLYQVTK